MSAIIHYYKLIPDPFNYYFLIIILLLLSVGIFYLIDNGFFISRCDNIDTLFGLAYFILSLVLFAGIIAIIILILDNEVDIPEILSKFLDYIFILCVLSIFSIVIVFIVRFFMLLYYRIQDFGLPGYYIIGIIPILNWFIGIKTFKSGKKTLGVLIFLNLLIIIPYLLFFNGDKGLNYFGISKKICRRFKKDRKQIFQNKFLNQSEKKTLMIDLKRKYSDLEISLLTDFKKNEMDRLSKKEVSLLLNTINKESNFNKEDITDRINSFYRLQIERKLTRFYSYKKWN